MQLRLLVTMLQYYRHDFCNGP